MQKWTRRTTAHAGIWRRGPSSECWPEHWSEYGSTTWTSASGVEILKIFDLLNGQGKTIILVTHDQGVACHSSRTVRLRDGLIESDIRNGR